jgi:hypothetical protein
MSKAINLPHRLTALLCCALTLSLHVLPAGCGVNYSLMDDGSILIPFGPSDSIVSAVKNTQFARPIALRANPHTSEYHVSFDGGAQQVFGKFTLVAGRATLTSMTITRGELSAQIGFDTSQRILSIKTSDGKTWDRPPESIGFPVKRNLNSPSLFETANADILFALQQLDYQNSGGAAGGSTGGPSTPTGPIVKVGQSSETIIVNNNTTTVQLSPILDILGLIFGFNPAPLETPILQMLFQVSVSIQIALIVLGFLAPGAGGPGGSATQPPSGVSATLRVVNNLTGETPIWFVTLVADIEKNLAGGNLLGEEAIPAGTSRDFSLQPGTRDFNIIVPSGATCFELYEFLGVVLTSGAVTEIVITDSSIGEIIPDGCDNG